MNIQSSRLTAPVLNFYSDEKILKQSPKEEVRLIPYPSQIYSIFLRVV